MEAVDWLRAKGLVAQSRDSGLGQEIVISVGTPKKERGGILNYPFRMHLCPEPETPGGWYLIENEDWRERFDNLQAAVEGAAFRAERWKNQKERS